LFFSHKYKKYRYERLAIEKWIGSKSDDIKTAERVLFGNASDTRAKNVIAIGIQSPMGFGCLNHAGLSPNRTVKRLSSEWQAAYHSSKKKNTKPRM